jgi:cell division protein FtsX
MNALTENRNPRLTLLLLAVVLILVALAQGIYLLWPQYKQWQEQKNSEELLQRATRNNGNLEQQILQQRPAAAPWCLTLRMTWQSTPHP